MGIQEIQTRNYPHLCGALSGFLSMLPHRLCIEGWIPREALPDVEKFVQDNMKRIIDDAKQQNTK